MTQAPVGEDRPSATPATPQPVPRRWALRSLSREEMSYFFREMATLLDSGFSIIKALDILAQNLSHRGFAAELRQIAAAVERGTPLYKALTDFPRRFPALVVAIVQAGETGGKMAQAFHALADNNEYDQEVEDKVRSALAYPTTTLVVVLGAFLFLLLAVVPMFEQTYERLDLAKMPFFTWALVSLSHLVRDWWMVWIPLLIGLAYVVRRRWTANIGFVTRFKLQMPVFGRIITMGAFGRFVNTLRLLLSSAVPVMQALQVAKGSLGNAYLEGAIDRMIREVERGRSMTEPLKGYPMIPAVVVDMMLVGEQSGRLVYILGEISKALRTRINRIVDRVSATIEPVLLVVIGLLVLLVALSLFYPYWQIASAIGDITQ